MAGVGNDGRLLMTTDRALFEWPLTIRRGDSRHDEIKVALGVTALAGPSGELVPLQLLMDGTELTGLLSLPAGAQKALVLRGTAAREGVYTGELSFVIEGKRTPVPLALTRTHPELELRIDEISRIRSTIGANDIALRVRLQNTSSAPREIRPPIVTRLDRIDSSGNTPLEVGVAPYTVSYALSDGKALPVPLTVAADAALDLGVSMHGINDPGTYKGTLRVTAADRIPIDKPFELAVRLNPWLPALAIAAGVLVAALLRWFQQAAQPRLLLQRDAIGLRSKLVTLVQAEGPNLIPRERQAIAALTGRLDEVVDVLADPNADPGSQAPKLDDVRRKLPLLPEWIAIGRRIAAVRPPSVTAPLDAELNAISAILVKSDATDADITNSRTTLNGLDDKLKVALKEHALRAVAELRGEINRLPKAEQDEHTTTQANLDIGRNLRQMRHGSTRPGLHLIKRDQASPRLQPGSFAEYWIPPILRSASSRRNGPTCSLKLMGS